VHMIQLGSYSGGSLVRYENFLSQHIQARHVDVWCPPGYGSSTARYPVIYMHDGQNLFEPAWSSMGIDWGVDEAVARLITSGVSAGAIVVGIWNSAQRRREYMPQKPLMIDPGRSLYEEFVREQGGAPRSDAYLRFMVEELKPFIDAAYRTLSDRAHTLVMGSSMGGLISLYALTEYPAIFSGAGCVSTHWTIGGSLVVDHFGGVLPRPDDHKIYFDYGTETQDAFYEPYQLQMDALLQAAGYRRGVDWLTRKFIGAEHSERAWRARVEVPLKFLLI
jgi:predicted alpha/beta superfamily hydrolase